MICLYVCDHHVQEQGARVSADVCTDLRNSACLMFWVLLLIMM